MNGEVGRATADLLREALGKVLQVPYGVARRDTKEFHEYCSLIDPALQALYFALKAIEPLPTAEVPASGPQQSADLETDDVRGDSESDPALFPPPAVVMGEADDLLERVVAQLREASGLDDEAKTEIAAHCSVAQETIRKTLEHFQHRAV